MEGGLCKDLLATLLLWCCSVKGCILVQSRDGKADGNDGGTGRSLTPTTVKEKSKAERKRVGVGRY